MKIITERAVIAKTQKEVFDFLSDFVNYKKIMPSGISKWNATSEYCTFVKDKIVSIGMKFEQKICPCEIRIVDYAKNAFPYSLTIHIMELEENSCTTHMIFEGEPNAFLRLMVERQLTTFFNDLNQQLKGI